MSHSDILHAVHELTNFKKKFVDDGFDIPETKLYYHANKRKRKTNLPQKRELSEDDTEDTHSSENDSAEPDEPINLMKRDSNSIHTTESISGRDNDIMTNINNLSLEQNRMYSVLLNYLLMKYHIQTDSKDMTNLPGVNKMINRSPDIKLQDCNLNVGGSTIASQLFHPIISTNFRCIPDEKLCCGSEYALLDGTATACSAMKANNLRFGLCQNESWKQSIAHAINSCIHDIPIPKSGYENYETMLLCYKSLIEKACALQQAVDVYLNLLQNTAPSEGCSSESLNGCASSHIPSLIPGRVGWSLTSTAAPAILNQSPSLTAALTTVQRILPDVQNTQQINSEWRKEEVPFLKCDHSINPVVDTCFNYYPVDLTKSEKVCSNKLTTQNHRIPSLSLHKEMQDKADKGSVHFMSRLFNKTSTELATHSEYNAQSSHTSSTDFNLSPSSDKFEFSPRSLKDQGSLNTSHLSETIPSAESNYSGCNTRSGIPIRRKSYFKTKRLKKSFSSNGPSVEIDNVDCSQAKKSNFRGTSEEENKVAPDFQPIEVNSQIILCEAHPNVKLSKDIFYSLIVKSSGSATRLIRLLMKSFFTQDELAASSLSGEGIYKQRLEPSVTEAIKIFIRRRHPQLKTGSINLCMTDVCVQARRVANNQRSRQHPIRLTTYTNMSAPTETSSDPSPPLPPTTTTAIGRGGLLGPTDRLHVSSASCTSPVANDTDSPMTVMDVAVDAWGKSKESEAVAGLRFSQHEWVPNGVETKHANSSEIRRVAPCSSSDPRVTIGLQGSPVMDNDNDES